MDENNVLMSNYGRGSYGWLNLDNMLIYRERNCVVVKTLTTLMLKGIVRDLSLTREDAEAIIDAYRRRERGEN